MTDVKIEHIRDQQKAFQEAYAEIQTTSDPCRYAYLKWIGYQMWKIYDYESGLEAIKKNWQDCKEWRGCTPSSRADAKRDIEHRDSTGEPVTVSLKQGLFSK